MLHEGDIAPSFSLPNQSGQLVSLKNFVGKKVVLYFYPKDHTPGCTKEACDFRDATAQFKQKNTLIFGISRDPIAKHQSFREKFSLPFDLLADTEGKMCEQYGVIKEKSMFGKKYLGVERSTFLIDETGKIEKIWRKVSVLGHSSKVLKCIP